MRGAYVVQINLQLESKLRAILEEKGFDFSMPPHTCFQAKGQHVSCTLYKSGKLVVQGSKMDEFITYTLEPEVLGTFTYGMTDETARIGVDESGKGDYFGPLCIAALYAKEGSISNLKQLGVKDSKRLNDKTILSIASKIEKNYPHSIVRIGPKRYNALYEQFGNLNLLLGWGHATAIDELLGKIECPKVIIDQFAAEHIVEQALKRKKRDIELIQRTKGEEDTVVAGASILARAAFVRGMDKLSQQMGITLPKGAGSQILSIGRRLVATHGASVLTDIGKLHFKTTEEIIQGS